MVNLTPYHDTFTICQRFDQKLLAIFVNKVFLTDEMLKFALVAANTLGQGELPFDTAGTTV